MFQLELQRRLMGLTQQQLGDKLLYHRSVISGLESGRFEVDSVQPRLRDALERFFGMPLEKLLSEAQPPRELESSGASEDR